MNIETLARRIFRIAETKDNVICPPEQVFANPNFLMSVTLGGHHLVWNDEEYQNLMTLLKDIGETEFYVLENIGATITERDNPYQTTVSVNTDYDSFVSTLESFDPPFGLYMNSFFIFGKSEDWGIYMCELPTVNIVGSTQELADKFYAALNIGRHDPAKITNFIDKEFGGRPEAMKLMAENYPLNKN